MRVVTGLSLVGSGSRLFMILCFHFSQYITLNSITESGRPNKVYCIKIFKIKDHRFFSNDAEDLCEKPNNISIQKKHHKTLTHNKSIFDPLV